MSIYTVKFRKLKLGFRIITSNVKLKIVHIPALLLLWTVVANHSVNYFESTHTALKDVMYRPTFFSRRLMSCKKGKAKNFRVAVDELGRPLLCLPDN